MLDQVRSLYEKDVADVRNFESASAGRATPQMIIIVPCSVVATPTSVFFNSTAGFLDCGEPLDLLFSLSSVFLKLFDICSTYCSLIFVEASFPYQNYGTGQL